MTVHHVRRAALLLLAPFFVLAGVNHFANPDFYVAMMPPWVPAHRAMVFVSGVFAVLGGIGVIPARTRSAAGWGLVFLLLAVFPANVHVAMNPELFPSMAPAAPYARLPLQAVLIAWAYWATRPDSEASRREHVTSTR